MTKILLTPAKRYANKTFNAKDLVPWQLNDTTRSTKRVGIHWHALPPRNNRDGGPLETNDTELPALGNPNAEIRHRVGYKLTLRRPDRGLSIAEMRVRDMMAELDLMEHMGVDIVFVNGGYDAPNNPYGMRSLTAWLEAAERRGGRIQIAPCVDCTVPSGGPTLGAAEGQTAAADLIAQLRGTDPDVFIAEDKSASPYWAEVDGDKLLVLWKYYGNGDPIDRGSTPDFVDALRTDLEAEFGALHVLGTTGSSNSDVTGTVIDPAFSTSIDAVCDWGTRVYGADQHARAAELTGNGQGWVPWMALGFGFTNHDDPGDVVARIYEHGNTRYMRNTFEAIRAGGIQNIQLVTWNDVMEGSAVAPTTAEQFAVYDLMTYYLNWFKSGKRPRIVRDGLYYFHRLHEVDTADANVLVRYNEAVVDDVECVAFLVRPGDVVVTIGGVEVARETLPAGMHSVIGAIAGNTGEVRCFIERGGAEEHGVTSEFTIGAWDATTRDCFYRAGSSLRANSSRAPRPQADGSTDPDAWLDKAQGEPVAYVHPGPDAP